MYIADPTDWCTWHNVPMADGLATLYVRSPLFDALSGWFDVELGEVVHPEDAADWDPVRVYEQPWSPKGYGLRVTPYTHGPAHRTALGPAPRVTDIPALRKLWIGHPRPGSLFRVTTPIAELAPIRFCGPGRHGVRVARFTAVEEMLEGRCTDTWGDHLYEVIPAAPGA